MPRGGFRPGAGRPKKAKPDGEAKAPAKARKPMLPAPVAAIAPTGEKPAEAKSWPFGTEPPAPPPPAPDLSAQMPLDYLLSVMRDAGAERKERMQAASLAAPYCHVKPGEVGKKETAADKAKKAAVGRFAPKAPPRLVVSNK